MNDFGSVMYLLRASSLHVTWAFSMASEYLKPGTWPDVRSTTPNSAGPILFLPASAVWQVKQVRALSAPVPTERRGPWAWGPRPPRQRRHDGRAQSIAPCRTSGAYGFRFDEAGCFNHLFRPQYGSYRRDVLSVSVIADRATLADALSTALCVMALSEAQASAKRLGTRAYVTLLAPLMAGRLGRHSKGA